jgi:hypothetical protein
VVSYPLDCFAAIKKGGFIRHDHPGEAYQKQVEFARFSGVFEERIGSLQDKRCIEATFLRHQESIRRERFRRTPAEEPSGTMYEESGSSGDRRSRCPDGL